MQGLNRHHAEPTETSSLPELDLKVWRSDGTGWTIEFLSPNARRWARTGCNHGLREETGDLVTTDLAGANSLLHRARLAGLVSELAGTFAPVRI